MALGTWESIQNLPKNKKMLFFGKHQLAGVFYQKRRDVGAQRAAPLQVNRFLTVSRICDITDCKKFYPDC
jgi:hypothetical protein